MANFNLNVNNKIQNINQKNLSISGLYSIINKNSNIIMQNNNISGSIFTDKSQVVIGETVNFASKKLDKIYATNNSQIVSKYDISVNLNNNSIYNFNYPLDDFGQRQDNKAPIDKLSSTYSQQNTNSTINDGRDLSADNLWNPYLVNDGDKFIWFKSDNLNDYYLTDSKKHNFEITQNATTYAQLNATLSAIPKNLYGKNLEFLINTNAGLENVVINGFYNGTVIVDVAGFDNGILSCKNIENLIIKGKTDDNYIDSDGFIKLENVENCIISGVTFEGSVADEAGHSIDNLSSKFNYNQQIEEEAKRITGASTDKVKFKLYIVNSNVTLNACTFVHCAQLTVYCTLNSKLTAYNNTYTFNWLKDGDGVLYKRRPIIYYISKNSFCTAYGDIIRYQNAFVTNNKLIEFKTEQQKNFIEKQYSVTNNEQIKFTFLYGYAYHGSFFNHEHKSKFIKAKQLVNRDMIQKRQLPLGSIYEVPSVITQNKCLDGSTSGYAYTSGKTIGYHQCSATSAYIGISFNGGYYQYNTYKNNYPSDPQKRKDKTFTAMSRQLEKLNQLTQLASTIIYPEQNTTRRYKSIYADNIKYAQIIRHHFNLKTNPYFNHELLSATPNETQGLYTSVPSALKYTSNSSNNQHQIVIQYSQFINYDKSLLSTNINTVDK